MPELVWEGNYGSNSHKVAPTRVALPFRTVETVNKSAQERERSYDLFTSGYAADWFHRLSWADKKYLLPALPDELAEPVRCRRTNLPSATDESCVAVDDARGLDG